jgi:hypothetical protein
MRTSIAAAVALTLSVPAAGQAQECAEEFAAIEKQVTGSALQAEYKGREAAHPLVLNMKGGEIVDLTGTIVTATPYESWTGDRPVVDKVGGFMTEAKPLIEAKNEEECLALLEKAKAEIEAFDEKAGTAPSGGAEAGQGADAPAEPIPPGAVGAAPASAGQSANNPQ